MGSLRHDPDRPPKIPLFQLSEMENEIFALDGAGLSHIGHVRRNNEDAILVDLSAGLWAIADGMGGHGHGKLPPISSSSKHLASLSRDGRDRAAISSLH